MTHTNPAVEQFVAALQQAEESRDPAGLVELFADAAELHTLASPDVVTGKDGAALFWTDYLEAFGSVKSEFIRKMMTDRGGTLEWVSNATLPNGKAFQYRGVSVLEVADGRVTRFSTYYDTAMFVTPPADSQPAG